MVNSFSSFLQRNTVIPVGDVPVIHSTRSYNIKKIIESGKIIARECDVFLGEKLNYFFVGRPAYKYESNSGQAQYWELPACFIFSFNVIGDFVRVFPFDSGAFSRGLYPDYIGKIPMSEYEVNSISDAPQRIIGAFFGDIREYLRMEAKPVNQFSSEFSLGVFDEELKALHKLSSDGTNVKFDDRRFSIEIQSSSDVDLSIQKPMAVICPDEYLEDKNFRDHIVNNWNAVPISYPIVSLSLENYYATIYAKVYEFFRNEGII